MDDQLIRKRRCLCQTQYVDYNLEVLCFQLLIENATFPGDILLNLLTCSVVKSRNCWCTNVRVKLQRL